MRPLFVVSCLAVVLLSATGCDLMSDPEGPRPEDFAVQEDTAEVRTTEAETEPAETDVPQGVAVPLATARGGVALGFSAPH